MCFPDFSPLPDSDDDSLDDDDRQPLRPGRAPAATHDYVQQVLDSYLRFEIFNEEGVILPRPLLMSAVCRMIAGVSEYHLCSDGCRLCLP
jgi:hypothetical protein